MVRRIVMLAVAVALMCGPWLAVAQQTGGGNSNAIWNNIGGDLGSRRPGAMVESALAQINQFQGRAFSRPEITAQEEDPDLVTQLKVSVIQTIFQNLNTVLLAFNNIIRSEGGLSPWVYSPIQPSTGGSLGSL